MQEKNSFTPSGKHILKFIVFSVIGAFLFLALLPNRDGQFNIPLGFAINWLEDWMGQFSFGEYAQGTLSLQHLLALIVITISFLGTVIAHVAKPKFIINNPKLKEAFLSSPIYFVSKLIALVVVWMIFLDRGPAMVINNFTGDVMMMLTAGLVVIFIVLAPAIPLLTGFGLMEFIGVIIRKFTRVLFTLPGRASVDLIASWFGSSAASIIITRDQHENGYYTGREAAVIATNFSLVSLPFTFVIARLIGLDSYFLLFYMVICITSILLAIVMPRLWPLRNIPDTYLEGVGNQLEEDVPVGTSNFRWAVNTASHRASKTTAKDVVKQGGYSYLSIFMDLIPIILAWGTLALIVVEAESIPVFDWLSVPMAWILQLFGVEGASDYAAATLVGFIDMYLPGVLITTAEFQTRFILGVLSIVQIVYLAETGALILKSKIPLGLGKLLIIFLMRTLLALPVIVLLTRLLF